MLTVYFYLQLELIGTHGMYHISIFDPYPRVFV